MNLMVIACIALLLYSAYAILIPPKWYRAKLDEDDALKAKRKARTYVRTAAMMIGIYSVSYERGHTTGIITKRTPQVFVFNGIARGDFSETLYLKVDQDGDITHFETDIAAKAAFIDSDLGIVAVTTSDDLMRFRDIEPPSVTDREMFKVRFTYVTSS